MLIVGFNLMNFSIIPILLSYPTKAECFYALEDKVFVVESELMPLLYCMRQENRQKYQPPLHYAQGTVNPPRVQNELNCKYPRVPSEIL